MTSEQPPYPTWMYRQSAALPYRWREGRLEVLLITSRKGKRWIAPKGIVEPGLEAGESAAKEAYEEAGVLGEVAPRPLGTYRYDKWGGTCTVEVYPLEVQRELDHWPEATIRRRRWEPLAGAVLHIKEAGLRAVMARLASVVGSAEPSAQRPVRQPDTPRLIYLLRHANSSRKGPGLDDFDRPLTPAGRRDAEKMGRYIAVADIRPDLVAVSPAARAQQTLEFVKPAIGEQAVVKPSPDLYGTDSAGVLDQLRAMPAAARSIMVVGHNPGLQGLAIELASGSNQAELAQVNAGFSTGALVTLVFDGSVWADLEPGSCTIHSLVRPSDIRNLGVDR